MSTKPLASYILKNKAGGYLTSLMCNPAKEQCSTVWTHSRDEANLFTEKHLLIVLRQLRKHCPNNTYTTINTRTGEVIMPHETMKQFTIYDGDLNKYLSAWVYQDDLDTQPLTGWRMFIKEAAKMSEQEAQELVDDMTDTENSNFTIQEYIPEAIAMKPANTEPVRALGNVQYIVMTDDENYVKDVVWNTDQTLKSVDKIYSVTNTEDDAGLFDKVDADLLLATQEYVLGYYEARIPF